MEDEGTEEGKGFVGEGCAPPMMGGEGGRGGSGGGGVVCAMTIRRGAAWGAEDVVGTG